MTVSKLWQIMFTKTRRSSRVLLLLAVIFAVLGSLRSFAQVPFLPATSHPGLTVTDTSPDLPYGTLSNDEITGGGGNTGGRVLSLAIDPTNSSIVYAATELAGVWKSTDAAHTWTQRSRGLRSGITQTGPYSLAVDATNPRRLLYVTQNDDGRPADFCGVGAETFNCTLGGLWISTSGAGSWQHVNIPNCPQPGISSVAFAAGQPFASTRCGLATTTDPNMASASWTIFASSVTGGFIASLNGGGTTLFACVGSAAYRSTSPGTVGIPWTAHWAQRGPCMLSPSDQIGQVTSPFFVMALSSLTSSSILMPSSATGFSLYCSTNSRS